MFVWMLVCAWIIGVIHTGTEIRIVEILILVVQSQRVANLLTRNQIPPGCRVVRGCIEVAVVHFHTTLRNVRTGDPHLCNPEPTIEAVSVVAHFNSAARGTAVLPGAATRNDDGVENRGLAPI